MVPPERVIRVLDNVFEEKGLLSDYGIRAVSAWHRDHPFSIRVGGVMASVDYEPAESTSYLFGGNSNWRGPIWMPLNALLVEALRSYDSLAPGELTVEYPAGSGSRRTLAAASSLEKDLKGQLKTGADKAAAVEVGKLVAERAKAAGVEKVVFDRGAYIFHGRVKALADAAREGGLEF